MMGVGVESTKIGWRAVCPLLVDCGTTIATTPLQRHQQCHQPVLINFPGCSAVVTSFVSPVARRLLEHSRSRFRRCFLPPFLASTSCYRKITRQEGDDQTCSRGGDATVTDRKGARGAEASRGRKAGGRAVRSCRLNPLNGPIVLWDCPPHVTRCLDGAFPTPEPAISLETINDESGLVVMHITPFR